MSIFAHPGMLLFTTVRTYSYTFGGSFNLNNDLGEHQGSNFA